MAKEPVNQSARPLRRSDSEDEYAGSSDASKLVAHRHDDCGCLARHGRCFVDSAITMGGDIAIQTANDSHRDCHSSCNDMAYDDMAFPNCEVYRRAPAGVEVAIV